MNRRTSANDGKSTQSSLRKIGREETIDNIKMDVMETKSEGAGLY